MSPSYLSYYDALGIKRDASPDEIKKAWRKQSLSLHPDKNSFGEGVMKYVNEAYQVLSDEVKRAMYDSVGHGNHGSNYSGRDSSSAIVHSLKRQLAESDHKRAMLKRNVVSLRDEVDTLKEEVAVSNSILSEQNRLKKQMHHKHKKIQNEVDYLKSKNGLLEEENQDNKRQIDMYEGKIEKAGRALREERRKSDDLARSEEKSKQKVEHVKKVMSERSVCYRCNGESISEEDCMVCKGHGAIQGFWTKCHNCNGAGSFITISGEEKSCELCSSKGARESKHSMICFKCKGRSNGKDCNVCYKGHIKGFNLQLCPLCRGKGNCENCFGRAFVSCRCGPSCIGHKPNETVEPSNPSSLQRRLALVNENERDWKANFLTRDWLSPL
ncbi:hypothetical protein ACHAXR_003037 [Thalassiosira sp. AJA248-18]